MEPLNPDTRYLTPDPRILPYLADQPRQLLPFQKIQTNRMVCGLVQPSDNLHVTPGIQGGIGNRLLKKVASHMV